MSGAFLCQWPAARTDLPHLAPTWYGLDHAAFYDHTMPSALIICMYALAVARITRLITHDVISEPIRTAIIRKFDPIKRAHRFAVYALGDIGGNGDGDHSGCPWCVSIWISVLTAPIVVHWQHSTITAAALLAMAASQVTGLISEYIGRRA
jgi:hypothetical protein